MPQPRPSLTHRAVPTGQTGEASEHAHPAIERRIAVRFGDAVLAAGHTAIPNLVLHYYAALDIGEGELVCTLQIWSYWWTARDPYPSIASIAARMGKSPRQIKTYIKGLQDKGMLRVVERFDAASGGQMTSEYDFSPLIEAVVGRARLDGVVEGGDEDGVRRRARATPAAKGVAGGGEEFLTPPHEGIFTPPDTENFTPPVRRISPESDEEQTDTDKKDIDLEVDHTHRSADIEPYDISLRGALIGPLARLGAEIGDDAPAATLTRVYVLFKEAAVTPEDALLLLEQATAVVRERRGRITKRSRGGQVNAMPYMLSTLESLLAARASPTSTEAPLNYWPGGGSAGLAGEDDRTGATWRMTETHPAWRAVLEALHTDMTPENFAAWFGPTSVVGQEGAEMWVRVPSVFHKRWLQERLRGAIERALRVSGHAHLTITFILDGEEPIALTRESNTAPALVSRDGRADEAPIHRQERFACPRVERDSGRLPGHSPA